MFLKKIRYFLQINHFTLSLQHNPVEKLNNGRGKD